MNILHLCDNLYNGGAQKVTITSINNLPEHNHHLVYLSPPENLKDSIKVPCVYIPLKKRFGIISTVFNIYKYCKKNKIDVINCSVISVIILGRMVAILSPKIKHITTYQGTPFMDYLPKARFYAKLDKLTQRKRFYYVAVSNAVKKHVHDKVNPSTNITVVYNCISNYYFENFTPKVLEQKKLLKFIFIGNNFPEKKVNYLVEVFSKLDPQKFELHVMGGGMEVFEKELTEKNITNITFHGLQKITKEMLRSFDVYVAAGIGEGCPLATVEAMTQGLPTATANTDAYIEVTNNKGYYFDPYNVQSGIDTLNSLYENQDKLQYISNENFEFSNTFKEQHFIDKMRLYYNSLT